MLKAAKPAEEPARVETLRQLDILDTPAEERFDRITRITAQMFDVPFALISLVDSERLWFKSCIGLSVSEVPREISFCAHAILGDGIFYVPDTRRDQRFWDHPLVKEEPHIRFYAGYPLAAPNGMKVGTLCILDQRPRKLNQDHLRLLRDLGEWARIELSTVQTLQKEVARQAEMLQEHESTFFELMEGLPVGVYVLDSNGEPYYANETAKQMLGKGIAPGASPDELAEIYHVCIAGTDEAYPTDRMPIVRALQGKSSAVDDLEIHRPDEAIHVQVWGTPIFHRGKVAYAVAAFQDITDRKKTERRFTAQHAVTRVLAESDTLSKATPKILQAVCESMRWQVGAIWNVDREANLIRCVDLWHAVGAQVDEFESLTRRLSLSLGVGLPGRVWANGEPSWIPDIVEDANFPRTPAALKNGLHAAFAFPIRSGREVTAVIEFFNKQIQKPDEELLSMMGSLGSQIGQFMARKQAEEQLRKTEERFREISTQL